MYVSDPSYANMLAGLFHHRHSSARNNLNFVDNTNSRLTKVIMSAENSFTMIPNQLQKCQVSLPDKKIKNWTYTCMRTEICCPTGCCNSAYRKLTQFWYLWFMLTIIVAMLFGCFHYYKKQRLRERRQQQQQQNACRRTSSRQQRLLAHQLLINASNRDIGSLTYHNNEFEYFVRHYGASRQHHQHQIGDSHLGARPHINEDILERFFANFEGPDASSSAAYHNNPLNRLLSDLENVHNDDGRNQLRSNQPPSYETLVKNFEKTAICEDKDDEEPPPVYLEACKMIEQYDNDNVVIDTGNENLLCGGSADESRVPIDQSFTE